MTIGEKIKKLRQKDNITQEKLAEYLGISFQSVSKWENNIALPDVTLIVPIANFFGVTTDELFDRDQAHEDAEVEEYQKRSLKFQNKGMVKENLELWREAVKKYPKNFTCLSQLEYALFSTLHIGYPDEEVAKNAEEMVGICERILSDCTDNDIREGSIQTLTFTYSNKNLPFADEEKSEKYAMMAGSMVVSREVLLEQAYFTDEGKKKAKKQIHHNNLDYMDFLVTNIESNGTTTEEKIFALETALKLWSTLIYDGNFLFYHCRISSLYHNLAIRHAELGHRDETLENLRLAKFHADAFDSLEPKEKNYTSIFVNCATSDASKSTKNYTETNAGLIRRDLENDSRYNFLREDEEFIEFMKSF